MEHKKEDEISRVWREIITESDFLSKMITAIKIRNGMDQQSFQSHIAYSSGQPNNQYVKTGSNTVIELFKIANLIEEVDGKLSTKPDVTKTVDDLKVENKKLNSDVIEIKVSDAAEVNEQISVSQKCFKTSSSTGISINIDIKIVAKVSEVDELGIKLKKMLKELDSVNDSCNEN